MLQAPLHPQAWGLDRGQAPNRQRERLRGAAGRVGRLMSRREIPILCSKPALGVALG